MPKPDPKKPHQKGVGIKPGISPADFIKLFISDRKQYEWASGQVSNEGPEHKQVLNAVLLQQLAGLVKAIEAKTRIPFQLQPGEPIISKKHEEEITIPVSFPLEKIPAENKEAILKIITKAPEHESLVYAILQQVATWGTKALTSGN